jgi:hypothetical protein
MDTVTILRELWRVRHVVVIIAVLASLAGTAVIFKISFPPKLESRRYEVGVATARILVDTPSSQVVEVAPKGSDTLGVRANLLASLMVDGVIRSTIAKSAGLQPNQLIGVTDAVTDQTPTQPTPGRRAFVLKTQVLANSSGDQLPIIEIDAQAPDRAQAARLAGAAVSGLRDYLNSKAALQRIPDADRLQVIGLGAPQAADEAKGASGVLALVVAILLFLLGCGGVLAMNALRRGWQAASEREAIEDSEPLDWSEEDGVPEEPYPVEVPSSATSDRDDWLDASPRPTLVRPPADEPPARTAWGG